MQHRAPAAPRAPRVNPPPPPLLSKQDRQQKFSAPSHQISDDPYAFHPSDYAGHVSTADDKQEDAFNGARECSLEEEEGDSIMKDDGSSEAAAEKEEQASPYAEDSPSDWEPSSENSDELGVEAEDEEKPDPPSDQEDIVRMARKKTTTTTAAAAPTSNTGKKSALLSGPDSSFAIYLSAIDTKTSNGATTSKVPSSVTVQQKQTNNTTTAAAAAAAAVPPISSATANPAIPKKKKKLTFADQTALPIMIPKGVAREPAGTALLIELPHGVDLAGASGVIGRIVGVGDREADGGTESDSDITAEAEPKSGVVLDLMGIQYSTEVIQLPSSLAVAHLTGDRLLVDSILTTAVRAAAAPGTENESVYSMEFDSDLSDYEDNTFGGGGGSGSGTHTSTTNKKKATGGTQKKPAAARKAGAGVRKPRGTTATKKRATSSRAKGVAKRK